MKTREQILDENPLQVELLSRGVVLKPFGAKLVGLCPLHKEKTPSFNVDPDKQLFHCFGCNQGGSVIDLVMKLDGLTLKETMRKLAGDPEPTYSRSGNRPAAQSPPPPAPEPTTAPKGEIDTIYSYRDAMGQEVYQVVRMKPKDFRQRHKESGKWVWNMQGVNRVLYNLPKILKANSPYIWVVEGEKDADNLLKCGFVSTCNVGGAGKWLDGYSECLRDKEVILCGDNDDAGRAHMSKILAALAKIAKTIRRVEIPEPHKDVSDYIATFKGDVEAASKALFEMMEGASVLTGGVMVPVQSLAEMERDYIRFVTSAQTNTLDLSKWLPALGEHIRGLVPGELVTFLAATGVGKTAALQNLAIHAAPLETLLFELELPGSLTFERFIAISQQRPAWEVSEGYKKDGQYQDWRTSGRLNHIYVCSKSILSPVEMEKIILQTELKTGVRPKIVLVDYHQLVTGQGKTRYERASDVAEQLKIVAKSTGTIVVASSQVGRKDDKAGPEVFLNDAKDSGSVENSSGLVIGIWRTRENPKVMKMKILKNTKGKSGDIIECDFDGASLVISPHKEQIDGADVPQTEPML